MHFDLHPTPPGRFYHYGSSSLSPISHRQEPHFRPGHNPQKAAGKIGSNLSSGSRSLEFIRCDQNSHRLSPPGK